MHTDEPLCQDGFLACGDGNCIERGLFCNGEKDCSDGSDENTCGKWKNDFFLLCFIKKIQFKPVLQPKKKTLNKMQKISMQTAFFCVSYTIHNWFIQNKFRPLILSAI